MKSDYKDNINELGAVICNLFDLLQQLATINIPEIDPARDAADIYSLSEGREYSKSLLASGNEVLKEWAYNLNGSLAPEKVTPGSRMIVWWRCSKCGKTWQQRIKTKVKGGLMYPSCSYSAENNKRALNSIKSGKSKSVTDYTDLYAEWIDARDASPVSYGSEYKADWKCLVCGNRFKQIVKNRTLQ